MLRGKAVLTAAAFVAAITMSGFVAAQGCQSCDTGQIGYQQTGNGFGYPGSPGCESAQRGCGACGTGGCSCKQHLKDKWEHTRKYSEKVAARNRAWPKPFACADRQVYFSMWEPMIASGFMSHTTLNGAHFDAETNELNEYGRVTVSSIVNNLPRQHRKVWIHRDVDQEISDARLAEVKDVVSKWYSSQNLEVAFTERAPLPASGNTIENINRLNRENTPNPIIPVASGTSGTTDIGQ